MKTYTVTYQSQGFNLREAKKNLRDMFEYGYGGKDEIVDEMVNGLREEKPLKPPREKKS